jgi:hypothetical protein
MKGQPDLTPEWLATCERTRCLGTGMDSDLSVTSEASYVVTVGEWLADPSAAWVSASGQIVNGRGVQSEARFDCGLRGRS